MRITSPAFTHESIIPVEYTCDGEGYNPPLDFHDIPADTQTLVLVVEDPDVALTTQPDGMFNHWIVWNISPGTRAISENSTPEGEIGAATDGNLSYIPPCPPDREHRYFFKLFALDVTLTIAPGSTKEQVLGAMSGHILAQAELMGRYDRHRDEV